MPLIQVTQSFESSSWQLMESLKAVVVAAKQGGGSAALAAAVGQVVTVVADIEALPADVKADEAAFIKGAVGGAADLALAALGVA